MFLLQGVVDTPDDDADVSHVNRRLERKQQQHDDTARFLHRRGEREVESGTHLNFNAMLRQDTLFTNPNGVALMIRGLALSQYDSLLPLTRQDIFFVRFLCMEEVVLLNQILRIDSPKHTNRSSHLRVVQARNYANSL